VFLDGLKTSELLLNIIINPSFLVKKQASRGYCSVTAFADVDRYAKPQPSLMLDKNSTDSAVEVLDSY
jgi:hypothetical protein